MEIKDYCKVYNLIPTDLCEKIINENKNRPDWQEHIWYSPENDNTGQRHNNEPEVLVNANIECILPCIPQALHIYLTELKLDRIVLSRSEIKLHKYSIGAKMSPHFDLIRRNKDDGIPTISMVFAFNEDFEGGNFIMNEEVLKLKQGDVLLFPSTFLYRHCVTEVTKGTRFSGVTWAY
jgi:hypothetical protein